MSETATQPAPEAPDPFEEAFARLSDLGDSPTPQAVAEAVPEEPKPGEAPAPEAPPAPPEAEAEDEEGDEPPAPAEEPKESTEDLVARLKALVDEKKPAPAPAKPDPAPEPAVYTEDESKFLQEYVKEWPDVAKAEALRRRAEYRELTQFVFSEVAGYLKPYLEQIETVATRTHLSDLESKVTDYDTIRDKVVGWADTQPAYLRAAYQHVIQQGTVDEVSDLVDRWRKDTGAAPATSTAPRQRNTALPPVAKQAAAALAPVGSKRSAPSAGVDPNDFGAAFATFASGKL